MIRTLVLEPRKRSRREERHGEAPSATELLARLDPQAKAPQAITAPTTRPGQGRAPGGIGAQPPRRFQHIASNFDAYDFTRDAPLCVQRHERQPRSQVRGGWRTRPPLLIPDWPSPGELSIRG